MRTNIVIDDALMKQAMQASGARSKREVVEHGAVLMRWESVLAAVTALSEEPEG